MSDTKTDGIERGEKYTHDQYGEVKVTGLSKRIESADAEGVVDATVIVEYLRDPDSQLHTERDFKKTRLEKFLRSVDTETER